MTLPLPPFELEAPIAEGGMGAVWKGSHPKTGLQVAVKVVLTRAARTPEFLQAFATEVRAAASLDHPGVIRVYDYGVVGEDAAVDERLVAGSPWVAMAWASGGTLSSAPLPASWPELRDRLLAILDALAHVHARGVVHRDLKPVNILRCTQADPRPGWKLADFGIAWVARGEGALGARVGTPRYMAPEQVLGAASELGPWTDLYALGCVTWALVAGTPPFPGRTGQLLLRAHMREPLPPPPARIALPSGFQDWLDTMLAKQPADRFRRAADAAIALARLDDAPLRQAGAPLPTPLSIHDASTLVPELFSTEQGEPLTEEPPELAALDRPRQTHVRAAVPERWQSGRPPYPRLDLAGAGLGLLGLRVPPLWGRQAERQVLWTALREANGLGPRAVVVRGPSGIGRSRLLRWMAERSHELGAGHGVRIELAEGDTVEGALAAEHGGSDRDALLAWLQAQGERRTVVITIDDAHHDPASFELASWLLQQSAPVMVVVTVRAEALLEPTTLAALLDHEATRLLDLEPLSRVDQRRLLEDLLGLDPTLASELANRTRGNPGQGVALVQGLATAGRLEPSPTGFRLSAGTTADLPATLDSTWRARLDAALREGSPTLRHTLELAAALGDPVLLEDWAAVCGVAAQAVMLSDRLVRQGLARVTPGGWSWASPALPAALRDQAVAAGRWSSHHATCARVLEGRCGPHRLGRHLLEAGEAEQAASMLIAAVSKETLGASELLPLAERAGRAAGLGDDDLQWAQLQNARVRILSEQLPAAAVVDLARAVVDNARPRVADPEWRALFVVAAGAMALLLGNHLRRTDEAAALLAEVEVVGPEPSAAARVAEQRAVLAFRQGHVDDAAAHFDRAIELGRGRPNHVGTLANASIFHATVHHWDRCRELLDEALQLCRVQDSPADLARVQLCRGELLREVGEHESALLAYEEAQGIYDRHAQSHATYCHVGRMLSLARLERLDDAAALADQVVRDRDSDQFPGLALTSHIIRLLRSVSAESWRDAELDAVAIARLADTAGAMSVEDGGWLRHCAALAAGRPVLRDRLTALAARAPADDASG